MLENLSLILSSATGIVTLAKDAAAIAKDVNGILEKPDPNAVEAGKLAADLLPRLIALQTQMVTLQGNLFDLEKEKRRVDRFQAEAVRYALARTELGSIVYELQSEHSKGEPAHCICAACYEDQIKSILQPVAPDTLGCSRCKATFVKPDGRSGGWNDGIQTWYDPLDPHGN